jgi:hypothetical protein
MRLKYQTVKALCNLVSDARIQIRRTKDVSLSLKNLKWSQQSNKPTLVDYQYQLDNFCNAPNTILLDNAISLIKELSKSKSKISNFDELKSDIQFLEEYYQEESWNDVTRWLTNIDSTLRETFSSYIETIKMIRKPDDKAKK